MSYTYIIGFLNVFLNPDIYEKWKLDKTLICPTEFEDSLYDDNLLSDLVDKISALISIIRIYVDRDYNVTSFPVFYIEKEFLCLTFDNIIDNTVRIIYLNRTIFEYTSYGIYDNDRDYNSTRIRLFKI